MWPEILAAFAVAVVLGAAALLAGSMMRGEPAEDTASLAGNAGGLDLDAGPVTDPDAVSSCLAPDFAAGPAQVDVLYGVEQRTPDGTVPVLVLRNSSGNLLMCDMFGRDRPAVVPHPTATPEQPAVPFTTGRRFWDCEGARWVSFTMNEWLSVTDPVRAVQVRFVVDGQPGEWFTTEARGGYAHLQAWLTDIPAGAQVRMEERALDGDGEPVASAAFPNRPQDVQPCRGGDVVIG